MRNLPCCAALVLLAGSAAADTWPGGRIEFTIPEGWSAGATPEVLEQKPGSDNCRISLKAPVLYDELAAADPRMSEAQRAEYLAQIDKVAQAGEASLDGSLQAMVTPAVRELATQRNYEEIGFEQMDPSFSTHGLQLATLVYEGRNDDGVTVIWAIGAMSNYGFHLAMIEAPRRQRKDCEETVAAFVGSFKGS